MLQGKAVSCTCLGGSCSSGVKWWLLARPLPTSFLKAILELLSDFLQGAEILDETDQYMDNERSIPGVWQTSCFSVNTASF